MKYKFLGFVAIFSGLTASAVSAAPLQKTYDEYGRPNFTRVQTTPRYTPPPKIGWYVGMQGAANLVSWTYTADDAEQDMSGRPQFGGSLMVGGLVSDNISAELEVGITGAYQDKNTFNNNDGLYFSHQAYFGALNAIYETPQKDWGGIYAGAGIGLAVVDTEFNDAASTSAQTFSPMGQIMFGYEKDLSRSFALRVGFKGSVYNGRQANYNESIKFGLGTLWNTALTLGIKYQL